MAGITLQQAQTQLDAWLKADTAVSKNQSYTISGRSYTRADAKAITEKIDYWTRRIEQLASGSRGSRVRYGVPQ